jgi:hypothetical protein
VNNAKGGFIIIHMSTNCLLLTATVNLAFIMPFAREKIAKKAGKRKRPGISPGPFAAS